MGRGGGRGVVMYTKWHFTVLVAECSISNEDFGVEQRGGVGGGGVGILYFNYNSRLCRCKELAINMSDICDTPNKH